jgi:hypothetical protein
MEANMKINLLKASLKSENYLLLMRIGIYNNRAVCTLLKMEGGSLQNNPKWE